MSVCHCTLPPCACRSCENNKDADFPIFTVAWVPALRITESGTLGPLVESNGAGATPLPPGACE
jgi:hypothetical protein